LDAQIAYQLIFFFFFHIMNDEVQFLAIGKPVPDFTAPAYDPVTDNVDAKVSLADYRGKWVLLFFYPLDFTFVCPTELIKLGEMYEEFKKNNCEIIAGSIDSAFSHQAWLKADARLKNIKFPIIADLTKDVGYDYQCIADDGMHFRGAFIIDPDGVLQSMTVNNLPVGRNPEELLRTLKAFQTGDLCPVAWSEGQDTLGKA
jgi:alkyl hydroperoxide reductase subunit AhpC